MRTTMSRRAYPSDLTDKQWEVLEPLIPQPSLDGRPPIYERREIVNAILYVLRSGCAWRRLSHDLPAWGTVYWYFRRWRDEGVWEQVLRVLRLEVRTQQGRQPEPTAAIIDSQSIKTSAVRGEDERLRPWEKQFGAGNGTCWWTRKAICWPSRSPARSTPIEPRAKSMLERVRAIFPTIKLLWGDSHYAGQLITWLKVHLGWSVQIVRRLKVPQRGLLVPRSAPRSSGIACFRQGFNRCPDDGWSNAPSPGSSAGVASAAIMRACLRVPRLSSRSRRPDACSRCSLLSSRKRWQPYT